MYENESAPSSATVADQNDPQLDEATQNLIKEWCERITEAKAHWKPHFKKIRKWQQIARLGATKEWAKGGNYVANITQRVIGQAVAQMYAKNPRAFAKLRDRIETTLWDGDPQSLMAAMQSLSQPQVDPLSGQAMVDPNAAALLADVQQAKEKRAMMERIGKTVQILFNYFITEQEPNFKTQMKQLIRRVRTCGIGYVELGFQRVMERDPTIMSQIVDLQSQIDRIDALIAEIGEGNLDPDSPKIADLRVTMETLQKKQWVIIREGLVFDFPRATEIIIDPDTIQIKGWIGTNWTARETYMTPEKVRAKYKVDIGSKFKGYRAIKGGEGYKARDEGSMMGADAKKKDLVCVWRVQDKESGSEFVIADGYCDWLKPPAPPNVDIEPFFTTFPLSFNDSEDEEEVYPVSDVELLWPAQDEYNRARQGLREHRRANRPKYLTRTGGLTEGDKEKLENHPANAIIELDGLQPGQDPETLLKAHKPAPIDPALYEVDSVFNDTLRTTGNQEANLGGTAGDTATETSVAEASRTVVVASGVDDLDDLLSALAKYSSVVMLLNMSLQTVQKIVGPGAVWPEMSAEEIVGEVYLDIKAGSSGRPNQTQDAARLERVAPFAVQLPGFPSKPIVEKVADILDIDPEQAYIDGLPSITALNAAAAKPVQPGTGDPASDPNQQGGEGGKNDAKPAETEGGGQPAYPAPGDGIGMAA
jgi:hypothetical protein